MEREFLTVIATPEVMVLLNEMAARLGPSTLTFAASDSLSDGRVVLSGLVLPQFAEALADAQRLADAMRPVVDLSAEEALALLDAVVVSREPVAEVLAGVGVRVVQMSDLLKEM